MKENHKFLELLLQAFPPPESPEPEFSDADIQALENEFGTALPEDYYAFLRAYGDGTFSTYFYVNHPFAESTETLAETNQQRKENYALLESDYFSDVYIIDGRFQNQEFTVTKGNPELAEFLRTEKIDAFTRSKIIALGNHYPYPFYPERKDGLIFWGYTDDEEFFLRKNQDRISIVLYDCGYYEFDMSMTEFIYYWLTNQIRLPMQAEEPIDWEFIPFTGDETL